MTAPPENAFARWQPLSGCRFLLVEDRPEVRDLYAASLRRAGAAVTVAGDGEAALAAWERAKPEWTFDAVVSDYGLPGMTGSELAARLRGAGFPGAIVGVTGTAGPEETGQWYAAGCDAVLRKGQTWRELIATVIGVCGRRWVEAQPPSPTE